MSVSFDVVTNYNRIKRMVHPLFVKLKKHGCSQCGQNLKISWINQVIYLNSPEAEGKDLPFGSAKNPIKYTFAIFECTSCGHKISINDQYSIEKPHKAKRVVYDDYHQYLKMQKDNVIEE